MINRTLQANSNWLYIVPWGLHKALTYIKEHYGNPTVILSENGMSQSMPSFFLFNLSI
jgi:beta-glucosidase/6-phospho-beta-glucosidase/beta-galactosidase